jgi:hypothetical protein
MTTLLPRKNMFCTAIFSNNHAHQLFSFKTVNCGNYDTTDCQPNLVMLTMQQQNRTNLSCDTTFWVLVCII